MIPTSSSLDLGMHVQALLKRLRWMAHPITIFVALQIVWLAITLIWVIWFVGQQEAIADLARRFGREYFDSRVSLTILVVGCVLLGVLLVGTISLFTIYQKQSSAARQQRTFVSSVTHELKSPLASLQLSVETMAAHKLDDVTAERMRSMIQADIDRLRRLVDQILVAGRLDRGIVADDDAHPLKPREVIEITRDKLSYLDPRLADRLVIDCSKDLEVICSRGALHLTLNNLIENAIKYSDRAAPIQVGVDVVNREMYVYVKDQGLGMDQKDKRRVFKMFYRNESAIRKAIPGTGLGLFIVKSTVRSLGGRVWVESPGSGQGSTFHVVMPATVASRRTHG